MNAVALLGEKYKTAAQDMRRIPNKNAMCIRCQAHFDDHLNRCDQCGKFVRGGSLEEFLELQASLPVSIRISTPPLLDLLANFCRVGECFSFFPLSLYE